MYKSTEDPVSHECDHCGAPLPPFDETGTRQCSFCKTTFRAPTPTPAPAGPPPIVFQTVAEPINGDFKPVNAPTASTGKGCGLGAFIVLIVIVGAIGLPLYLAAKDGFGGLTGSSLRLVEADPLLLPGEPSAPQAFITMSSRYDSGASASVYSLLKSDGTSSGPVWTTDLTGQAYGERPILTDGTSAIVAIDAVVFGVNIATGAITWQTTLTDVVQFSNCNGCFEIFGTSLVTTTADGNVQGIDTTTGAATWSRRLTATTNDAYAVGANYVVLDGADGDHSYRLVTLDPATGAEVMSFIPTCQDPESGSSWATELSTSSTLLASSTPGRIWFMDGSSPTCIQQYDVLTGALASQALVGDESGSITSSPRLLETPLGLVISSYGTLGIVDPTGATSRQVIDDETTDLLPFGATPSAVMVVATNKRGTATTAIRAIDPNSGATFWEAKMGQAVLVDTADSPPNRFEASSPSQAGVFTAHVDGADVRVLTFKEYPDDTQQVILDSFDGVTGTAKPAATSTTGSDDIIPELGPGVWTGSRLLTSAGDDRMLVVDFTTMTVTTALT